MKYFCVDHPFPHHGYHSGYKVLGQYLTSELIEGSSYSPRILDWIPESTLNRYLKLHPNWYSRQALLVEFEISKRLFSQANNLFHFLYGENSFHYTGRLNAFTGHRNRITATFHQIPAFFEQRRNQFSFLRTLDAAVLVSSNQLPFFESTLNVDKIHVIPHGVDTDYFRPSVEPLLERSKINCLTVGSNYRDIDLHISVIKALNKTSLSKNFEFQVIGEPRFSDIYSKIGNVNYLSGISDKSLLETYQNADILLMPLTDATANNGILEGMACGIPIVVTDVGGIKDYVDDCFARLLPLHDVEAMIESVITLSNDNEMRKSMGQLARLKAEEKFSWKNIATRMIDLYDSIS